MNESLFSGILVFGILQSVFFALLFSTKKDRSLPDKIMGVWLMVLALQTLLILVNHQTQAIPLVRKASLLMTLLYGPMLYLYASKLSLTKTRLTASDFLHFVPFLLLLLVLILIPGEKEALAKIFGGTSAFLGMGYCIVCFILLRNHQHSIENKFSSIDKINLVWINRLVISLLIIWTGVIILVTLNRFLNISISLNWFFTMIPLFIFYIGYFGIKQQAIYYSNVKDQNIEINAGIRKTKKSYDNSYVKSGLLPDTMKAIYARLMTAMQKDKLYLNPTLSLSDLSEEMKLPSHHITQTLNEYAKINFYDFVNEFRVEEFKGKIQSGEAQEFSLLGIAFDCGFNSKSSFNRVFRKFTAQSPSEYNINCSLKNLNR